MLMLLEKPLLGLGDQVRFGSGALDFILVVLLLKGIFSCPSNKTGMYVAFSFPVYSEEDAVLQNITS